MLPTTAEEDENKVTEKSAPAQILGPLIYGNCLNTSPCGGPFETGPNVFYANSTYGSNLIYVENGCRMIGIAYYPGHLVYTTGTSTGGASAAQDGQEEKIFLW